MVPLMQAPGPSHFVRNHPFVSDPFAPYYDAGQPIVIDAITITSRRLQ